MLNLPESTAIRPPKIIYKKTIYERFKEQLSGKKKESFDGDIARISLTNELSEKSLHLPKTDGVPAIYVARIDLKTKDFSEDNIALLPKLFGQKMLLVLAFEGECRLALYEEKLLAGDWQREEEISIELRGLNLGALWENIACEITGIEVKEGESLRDAVLKDEEKKKLKKQIESLEKRAAKETQSKKKLALFQEIKARKKELEEIEWKN